MYQTGSTYVHSGSMVRVFGRSLSGSDSGERRFAGGKRFATDDGKRNDLPWYPRDGKWKERGGIVAKLRR